MYTQSLCCNGSYGILVLGTINKQDIKIILAVSGDNDVSSESGSGRDAAAAACIKLLFLQDLVLLTLPIGMPLC